MSDEQQAPDYETDADNNKVLRDAIDGVARNDPTRFTTRSFAVLWNQGHSVRLINRDDARKAISIPWDELDALRAVLSKSPNCHCPDLHDAGCDCRQRVSTTGKSCADLATVAQPPIAGKWDKSGLKEAAQRALRIGRTHQETDIQLFLDMLLEIERLEAAAASPKQPSPQSEPWRDEMGHAWEIRQNVTCVECPHCCFMFAAVHGSEEGYDCPNCEGCPAAASLQPPQSETREDRACPCLHTTPCQKNCTCVRPFMSHGCLRCCSYGSQEQRRAKAEQLAAIIDAASPPPPSKQSEVAPDLHWPFAAKHPNCAECQREYEPVPSSPEAAEVARQMMDQYEPHNGCAICPDCYRRLKQRIASALTTAQSRIVPATNIQRFNCVTGSNEVKGTDWGEMDEDPNGEYVRYSDHVQAIVAERSRATELQREVDAGNGKLTNEALLLKALEGCGCAVDLVWCTACVNAWVRKVRDESSTAKGYWPTLVDRGDGVRGHYCIGRLVEIDKPYWEYWNKGQWTSAGEVLIGREVAQAQLDKIAAAIRAAKQTNED